MKRYTVHPKRISNKIYSNKFKKLIHVDKETYWLSHIPYMIHCGRHSGFPDCCIKFYVTKWIWLVDNPKSKFVENYRKKLFKDPPGYIPCPKCFKSKNFVKVKPCPKSCLNLAFIWGKNWWEAPNEKKLR